jgi:hypothetical protein
MTSHELAQCLLMVDDLPIQIFDPDLQEYADVDMFITDDDTVTLYTYAIGNKIGH